MWEGAEVDTCCEVDLTESERRIKVTALAEKFWTDAPV